MTTVTRRQVLRALVVYLAQIPILVGYVLCSIPVHPIATVMPLVVFLNARVDGRGPEGLGLGPVTQAGRWLLLIALFAALGLGGRLVALRLEGIPLQAPALTLGTAGSLARDLAVDILIIALWEEIVSRGYIQTRLQEAWGIPGVLVATVLFASLHLPSALHDHGRTATALVRFVQVGLGGFIIGYVYWRAGSVLVTIALHGLRNFVGLSLVLYLGDVSVVDVQASRAGFQLLWLVAEVGLIMLVCEALFGSSPVGANRQTSCTCQEV